MIITLRELEPFNIPPVDNQQAAWFMKRLTGKETFMFNGQQKPQAVMFYSLKYNFPHACFAAGYLLSVNIDTFDAICSSEEFATMEEVLKKYAIGHIEIEYGGDLTQTRIYADEAI